MTDATPGSDEGRPSLFGLISVSVLLIAVAGLAQIVAGAYDMTWTQAVAALVDPTVWSQPGMLVRLFFGDSAAHALGLSDSGALPTTSLIVWNIRLPRVLVGIMVGINLSISGAIFQAITRNELASPYLLGVSSGAGLAILLVLVLFPVLGPLLPMIAMVGGASAFIIVYAIAWRNAGTSPVRLILAGVIVAAIAGSLQTGLFFLAKDLAVVQNALAWTAGSLTGAGWPQVRMIAPWTIVCVLLAFCGSRYLDVLLLGDPTSRALGIPVERARFLLAATAIAAASSSVAVAGLIGFVGLVVPHIARGLIGSIHRRLFTACLFAGPALLVSADAFARLLFNPVQVPVGIVTGILGGFFFLYLMRRREFGKL